MPPGDVIFHIRIAPHATFLRAAASPADLTVNVTLTLSEALLGFDRVVLVHLDGRGLRVISGRGERVIQHGDEYRIIGEGMPLRGRGVRGNLYVKFAVEMPSVSWAARQDGDTVTLPPGRPGLEGIEVVDTRYLADVRR